MPARRQLVAATPPSEHRVRQVTFESGGGAVGARDSPASRPRAGASSSPAPPSSGSAGGGRRSAPGSSRTQLWAAPRASDAAGSPSDAFARSSYTSAGSSSAAQRAARSGNRRTVAGLTPTHDGTPRSNRKPAPRTVVWDSDGHSGGETLSSYAGAGGASEATRRGLPPGSSTVDMSWPQERGPAPPPPP